MITFTNLADSDHSHFAQNLFEEAFPEQERPPFSIIRQRDAGKFHFLVAENGDEPVGILTYWTFDGLVYVEHFAIDEELRNQGLGKAVFLNFLSQQHDQVVLEIELMILMSKYELDDDEFCEIKQLLYREVYGVN